MPFFLFIGLCLSLFSLQLFECPLPPICDLPSHESEGTKECGGLCETHTRIVLARNDSRRPTVDAKRHGWMNVHKQNTDIEMENERADEKQKEINPIYVFLGPGCACLDYMHCRGG